ncbi:MAG: Unknown protein [uncultured Sulfurovum sp.]|uniref:Uncharacterized protein n=1 Tax=uncultured Sulfurovum sp. TaxID=269237 RepID=A0A6S6T543_9BACT|nr:MAG: Unknown protein [uncultured Sulfurovum sp.]
MKKVGIGIDYSNICKDYNTSYLDRDNNDPATTKCMREVLAWTKKFLSALLEKFDYTIHNLSSTIPVTIDNLAAKRFLFYSLEKEITLQSYVIQKEYMEYESLSSWETQNNDGLLIQNDEDGEGMYLYFKENSEVHQWIKDTLKTFSLDEVDFQAK